MNSSNGNFLDENGNPVNIVQLLKTGKAVPVENPGPGLHMAAHSGWFTDENGKPVNIVALIDAAIDEDGSDEPAIGGISINGGSVVTPDKNGIINLTISGDGSTVIDSELSASSTNPVQNKVVTEEIADLNEAVEETAGALSRFASLSIGSEDVMLGAMSVTNHTASNSTIVARTINHIPVKEGSVFKVKKLTDGVIFGLAIFPTNILNDNASSIYWTKYSSRDVIMYKDGYAMLFFKNADGSELDPSTIDCSFDVFYSYEDYLSAIGYSGIDSTYDINRYWWRRGTFANKQNGAVANSTIRLCISSITFPRGGKVTPDVIKCDEGYGVCLWFFDATDTLILDMPNIGLLGNYGYVNEADVNLAFLRRPTAEYFKVSMSRIPESSITQPYQVMAHFYKRLNSAIINYEDIFRRFPGTMDVIAAGKQQATGIASHNITFDVSDSTPNLVPIIHLTDVHGDRIRFRSALHFRNGLGALIGWPTIVNTGDIVAYESTDPLPYDDPEDIGTGKYLFDLGNHDTFDLSEEAAYTKFIEPLIEPFGYIMPENIENPTYYYYDDATKKVRYIAVNDYQFNGRIASAAGTIEKCYHQEQIDWFCETLLSTPADYGVIILKHFQDGTIVSDGDNTSFNISGLTTTGAAQTYCPIKDIVDAWISGGTINRTYTQSGSYITADYKTITVSADFSTKASNTEFICYMMGHTHGDFIGYYANTQNRQTCLRSICTNAWYHRSKLLTYDDSYTSYNEGNDMSRINGTPAENAFNFYVVDRLKKVIRVVRIGSRLTCDFTPREHMVISYAQPEPETEPAG